MLLEKVNLYVTAVVAIVTIIISSLISIWATQSQIDKGLNEFYKNNYYADFQIVREKSENYIHLTFKAVSLISNDYLTDKERVLLFTELDQAAMSLMIYSGPALGMASLKLNMAIGKEDGGLTSEASNAWLKTYFAEMNAYEDTTTPIKTEAKFEGWLNSYLISLKGYAD